MDSSAPLTVAAGTLVTSATSALIAGIYGSLSSKVSSPGIFAASSGFNSAIAGATFFSFREYLVSPVLVSTLSGSQYTRRRRDLEAAHAGASQPQNAKEQLTWSEMRTHKVLDTALSGAFTGGLLNAWKRGRAGVLPGITTGALVCMLLQFGYNELSVARVKYISRRLKESPSATSQSFRPLQLSASQTPVPSSSDAPLERPRSRAERILDALGFHRLSDEEYAEMLRRKRDGYLQRIAILEEEIQEEKSKDKSDSSR